MATFQKSLLRVLAYEGGNVDDPRDAGGRTSRGVTQSVYDTWVRKHGGIQGDVWTAPDASIAAVYRENYWARIGGDMLPDGVALCVFDAAVNSGVSQAAKWVQRSLGLKADGDFGPNTIAAIRNCKDQTKLIKDICSRRLAMLQSLPAWKTFGKGWQTRVTDVQITALAWEALPGIAANDPNTDLDRVKPTPKAKLETKPKPMDQTTPNVAVAVGGIGAVIATLSSGFKDVADALSPLTATLPHIAEVCAVLTVIGVISGLYVSLKNKQHQAIVDGSAQTSLEG